MRHEDVMDMTCAVTEKGSPHLSLNSTSLAGLRAPMGLVRSRNVAGLFRSSSSPIFIEGNIIHASE